ncbi:MAG: hypothetical protein C4542_08575 [Dehalococcoidia bacterium]|nr:MAG: hypothetical protein C4542_08575 [Dehalococcoidia bacterium]
MSIVNKFRNASGTGIGCLGQIIWFIGGAISVVWTLYVLFYMFGIWTIFVGLLFAPITYVASILIVWFTTGVFPVLLLIPWGLSIVGLILMGIGGSVKGE